MLSSRLDSFVKQEVEYVCSRWKIIRRNRRRWGLGAWLNQPFTFPFRSFGGCPLNWYQRVDDYLNRGQYLDAEMATGALGRRC